MKTRLCAFFMVTLFFTGAIVLAQESTDEKQVREFGQDQEAQRREHKQEQKEENKVFSESLKGESSAERSEDIESQRSTRDQDNKKFNAGMLRQSKDFHTQQDVKKQERLQAQEDAKIPQESMDSLSGRFAKENKLTDAEKNELVSCFKEQYQKNISYRDEMYSGNVAFFGQIANDQSLTQEQKKAAIKSHFEEEQSHMK